MRQTPFGTQVPWSRHAALAIAASALCLASASAQERAEPTPVEVPEGPREAVIVAGQEELLATILGKGAALPNGCSLTNGNIQHTVLEATYSCPGGDVVYELVHPDVSWMGAHKSAKFALRVKSGTPPDGLTEALLAHVRAHEGPFQWTILGGSASPYQTWLLVVVLVALIALAAVIWRRRRRA